MAEQLIKKDEDFIKILPAWAQEMAYKYLSKTTNLYIIHGNIRDYLPNKMQEEEFVFVRIQEFISDVLFGNKDIIVFYDRSSGINFLNPEMQKEYIRIMKGNFPDININDFISRDPQKAFHYLEYYFLINLPKKPRIVLIIDYAETLVPNSGISSMSEDDRYCLVTLNRWSHDPIFAEGDISIILLTENLSELSLNIVRSPSAIKVNIPIPNEETRKSFLKFTEKNKPELELEYRLTMEKVAKITSGLNLINLNQLVSESVEADHPITLKYLKERKKQIIENEAGGLLEFIESQYDLDMVSGHDFVRDRFRKAVKAIKNGWLDVLPMGYLISGPIGTGKSFMVSAFAAEIGIPMVRLKNFRSAAMEISEANFEKVLNILKAMAPVGVMIDEADAFIGGRNRNGNQGRGDRIFAQLSSFMGNTEYRGKIIWFLITCRPDLIPIDLKRQGRAEEHLALFYPETAEEKEKLFLTLTKKLDIKIQSGLQAGAIFSKYKSELSGADIEAILIRAKLNANMDKHVILTKEDIEATLRDFVPQTYPHEIELQNLVAAIECTSREMVPKKFQNLDRGKLINQIRDLKILLGENIRE